MSSDERDALAFHPRHRRRSDHDERRQHNWRQFFFVADMGLIATLPLLVSARPKQKYCSPGPRSWRDLVLREGRYLGRVRDVPARSPSRHATSPVRDFGDA